MGIPILNQTLQAAIDAGDVSEATAHTLASASAPTSYQLGVKAEDIKTPKVTLCAVLLDDSGSMSGQHGLVIDALNERLIKPLRSQQSRNEILLAITSMWHGVLLPFTKISAVEQFDGNLFKPDGENTPLHRSVKDTLRLLVEKQTELALEAIGGRICYLTYTDGGENCRDVDLMELKKTIQDIDSKKANALYGIACGSAAKSALQEMGYKRITDANDPVALAEAFNQFSRATSAVANE
jgi:hypothetical protein